MFILDQVEEVWPQSKVCVSRALTKEWGLGIQTVCPSRPLKPLLWWEGIEHAAQNMPKMSTKCDALQTVRINNIVCAQGRVCALFH